MDRDLEVTRKEEEIEALKATVEKLSRASLGKQDPSEC